MRYCHEYLQSVYETLRDEVMDCQEVGKNLHKRLQEKQEEKTQRKSKHNEEKNTN